MKKTGAGGQEWSRGFARWAKECTGVDRQGSSVVSVRLSRDGRSVQSVQTVQPTTPDTMVVLSLSCAECVVRTLEAPFPSRRRAERVMPTLLDIQLPFALEDCVVRFMNLRPSGDGKTKALAVVARKSDITRRLDSWAAAGYDPVVVDHEGLALWTQSIDELPPDAAAGSLRVVVYAGSDRCAIVVGRGREFLGAHAVSADDPVSDIRRILPAYRETKDEPIAWVLSGPQAESPRYSGLPSSLAGAGAGTTHTVGNPSEFLARSIATRALTDGPLRCNFRTGDMAHAATLRRGERRLTVAAAMLLLAAVILWGSALVCRLAPRAEEARISRTMQALLDDIAGYPVVARGEHGLRVARDAFSSRMNDLQSFLAPFDGSLATLMCEIVDVAASRGVTLDTLALADGKVDMTGAGTSWNDAGSMAQWLEKRGYKVVLERMEAGADERIPFTLKAVHGRVK